MKGEFYEKVDALSGAGTVDLFSFVGGMQQPAAFAKG
jgi:hypothetical protein